jgi:thiol-disulfide isomerase/thioredoxin
MAGPAKSGIVLDSRVVGVGVAAVALSLAIVGVFMWMVPNAAAREEKAACRGLRGDLPLNPALCGGGNCAMPTPAPDFVALDHKGQKVKLSDFRGKVVLINFWASWCGVCKTEKPSIRTVANDLADEDFVVITLASDHSWTDILLALVDSLASGQRPKGEVSFDQALAAYQAALPDGIPFKVFIDPPNDDGNIGAITRSWGIKAVPESALIDRQGNLRAYFVNKRDWSSNVAETCIRSVIEE